LAEHFTSGNAIELESILPQPSKDFKKVSTSYWSSPEAMARTIQTWKMNDAWHASGWKNDQGDGWYGTNSMEDAVKLAMEGWPEGAVAASKFLDRIRAKNPIQLKRVKHAIVGAYPNVPRAISGNPLNMRTPDIAKASRRPIITFLSDTCVSWDHGSNELTNRAAVVAAIIEQVEAAGYACEVFVFSKSTGNGGMWFFDAGDKSIVVTNWVQVKNSNQPVDIARIAFGLGHPAMFRRFMFAIEGYHKFNEQLGSSLGRVSTIGLKGLAEKNIYVLPSVQSTNAFKTEELAETEGLEYIVDSLKEQSFPLFAEGFEKPEVIEIKSKKKKKK
jgi:hypothetical protein